MKKTTEIGADASVIPVWNIMFLVFSSNKRDVESFSANKGVRVRK